VGILTSKRIGKNFKGPLHYSEVGKLNKLRRKHSRKIIIFELPEVYE
jgi:hypothetical protein